MGRGRLNHAVRTALGLVLLSGCVSAAGEGPNLDADGFSRLDENGDGMITPEEFRGDKALFNRLDRNGDGVIKRGEISPRRPGPPPQRSLPDSRSEAPSNPPSGFYGEPENGTR